MAPSAHMSDEPITQENTMAGPAGTETTDWLAEIVAEAPLSLVEPVKGIRLPWVAMASVGRWNQHFLWRGGPAGSSTRHEHSHRIEQIGELVPRPLDIPAADVDPRSEHLVLLEARGQFWYGTRSRALRTDGGGTAQWFCFWNERTEFLADGEVTVLAEMVELPYPKEDR